MVQLGEVVWGSQCPPEGDPSRTGEYWVPGRHQLQNPWGLDWLGWGLACWFGRRQVGEVEPDIPSMWQCGHHRSCSNGGARSGNRMGLAYCCCPWGRWDSDICEPREYDEAHKWGTWGGWQGIVYWRVGIFNCFYTGTLWRRRRQVRHCVSERG